MTHALKRNNTAHLFSQVPSAQIQRSRFKRDHGLKTAFNSGLLVPIFWDEVLPADGGRLKGAFYGRLATPIVPVMDNLYLDTFFFFVPSRLLWNNFQKFMGEQENPGDSTDFLIPQVSTPSKGWETESIGDYLGLPINVKNMSSVNALPFRAYNLVWNQWFRDENLQDSLQVPLGDGPDDPSIYKLQRRGKRYDYFTSALPWPQKGPGVEIPLGQVAAINPTGALTFTPTRNAEEANSLYVMSEGTDMNDVSFDRGQNAAYKQTLVYNSGLEVDLSSATAITINSLRQAFQLQKLYEKDARGGTRYIELLKAHFGVTSPDARLQRAEYIGGSSKRININPVAQTSATDGTSPQGNLAAFGEVSDVVKCFKKDYVEHGYVIGLAMVRADLTYQQGIDKMWLRRTREDFYWPVLAHLGEQAILNEEIYAQGNDEDKKVFGYQERYAEYRYKPSKITGKLRSQAAASLDVWHFAQDFDKLPTLSAEFIEDNPPIERCLAVQQGEPQILLDCWFDYDNLRPMPLYGTPGLVDHF